MNGKILLNTPFKRLFIQPAAGDSGTALGVCYQIYNGLLNAERSEVMTQAWRRLQGANGLRPELYLSWEQAASAGSPEIRIHDKVVIFERPLRQPAGCYRPPVGT
jgi:hypothetical protein